MTVLVFNIGSSSLKAKLYSMADGRSAWEAKADWGRDPGRATVRYGEREEEREIEKPEDLFEPLLRQVPGRPDVVGHRVVDGGDRFREPALLTAEVRQAIREMAESAPQHNRLELAGIEAVDRVFGSEMRQMAVFDTAFHATLAPAAYTYPGPYAWIEKGIRRFGFHGINHKYVAGRAAELLGHATRIVSCHLGSGCSLAAIADGRSVDTTMGYTPLEGLMMGTRSGSVDPGVLIHLQREGMGADELDRVLNKESGLKGLSGVSSDLREIHSAIETGNERAKLAFDVFVHRLIREIGGMAAVLGGMDALVFTGGMGENDAVLRAAACEKLGFAGVALDAAKNRAVRGDGDISTAGAGVKVLVIQAREEWQIALEVSQAASL